MTLARKGILAQGPKEPAVEKTGKLGCITMKSLRSSGDAGRRVRVKLEILAVSVKGLPRWLTQ